MTTTVDSNYIFTGFQKKKTIFLQGKVREKKKWNTSTSNIWFIKCKAPYHWYLDSWECWIYEIIMCICSKITNYNKCISNPRHS